MARIIAAAVQMTSTEDKAANIDTAVRLLDRAAHRGARIAALPETFNCLGAPETMLENAEPIPGPTTNELCHVARRHKMYIVGGSLFEKMAGRRKAYNTSVFISPEGQIVGIYRKLHLFDAEVPGGASHRESDFMIPGDEIVVLETRFCPVGITICYDLRFPELYRALTEGDARIIFVPAAFTAATGKDHWNVLLRARAIENQVYVVAPNQFGDHPGGKRSHGRSMIVDPWGTVLAKAPDMECTVTAELSLDYLDEVRGHMQVHDHRRRDLFEEEEEEGGEEPIG
ncbi:MAG: carbon-nitrogen hydrolase family protein [Planctomycetes bacterium]|nr:carbon-nitrogen hydrolase family protein [Planctomycetota bacterium]